MHQVVTALPYHLISPCCRTDGRNPRLSSGGRGNVADAGPSLRAHAEDIKTLRHILWSYPAERCGAVERLLFSVAPEGAGCKLAISHFVPVQFPYMGLGPQSSAKGLESDDTTLDILFHVLHLLLTLSSPSPCRSDDVGCILALLQKKLRRICEAEDCLLSHTLRALAQAFAVSYAGTGVWATAGARCCGY